MAWSSFRMMAVRACSGLFPAARSLSVEGANMRVMLGGDEGRHAEEAAQVGVALFGDVQDLVHRGAGVDAAHIEPVPTGCRGGRG